MAIITSAESFRKDFNTNYWSSFEEYEKFRIQSFIERGEFVYHTDEKGVQTKYDAVNHHPDLKEYEIWIEGYAATGERGYATLLGKVKARNFAQAVHIYACEDYLKYQQEYNQPSYTGYIHAGRWDYDPNRLSTWGCRYFWSHELAAKSFG